MTTARHGGTAHSVEDLARAGVYVADGLRRESITGRTLYLVSLKRVADKGRDDPDVAALSRIVRTVNQSLSRATGDATTGLGTHQGAHGRLYVLCSGMRVWSKPPAAERGMHVQVHTAYAAQGVPWMVVRNGGNWGGIGHGDSANRSIRKLTADIDDPHAVLHEISLLRWRSNEYMRDLQEASCALGTWHDLTTWATRGGNMGKIARESLTIRSQITHGPDKERWLLASKLAESFAYGERSGLHLEEGESYAGLLRRAVSDVIGETD